MADARSLLRAHRAANRVEHPHAVYSDAGKLLCKPCREIIKSDSLWEPHVTSLAHRQKAAAVHPPPPPPSTEPSSKRKLDDAEPMDVEDPDRDSSLPKKRNRTASSAAEPDKAATPPALPRRTSGTPAHGVEISIPSRPATPLIGEGSQASTPNLPPLGRSPLIGSSSENAVAASANGSAAAPQIPISTESLVVPQTAAVAPAPSGNVDEAEWAAFEAEIAASEARPPPATIGAADYADAVISAPAMTADELAAKSQEEENARKRQLLDIEIADEKEDATRALEDEFDDMAQLDERFQKLKERRDELRKASMANLRGAAAAAAAPDKSAKLAGKENAGAANGDEAESDEDDEDEDEDWDDAFRFRGV
ncbi:hypothetical protein JX266_011918 [Neoarthrinium moseri]|uniref:uncharacterized protein n=1 Tax=Neoarthrinium moseri TaxID=1658444 RepID=UPI001FDB6588|nr:uncharacterized protein JN550_010584 [Neoarthrinium moseri]KAI1841840.1 hypothetical protein JX266_011918 [Neoarthrinium moseri]KAI1861953.1 hypothetical protein JN550_010584 [Neoarthrinium moseri]